mmetsp:Transcript_28676/g.42472  ORF Transcript_28676/g.42472 Transcript_28676/m.42472 type:complete len:338 (-) Transcript_28676:127-1140(-)
MSTLTGSIDKFEVDRLQVLPGGVVHHALPQDKSTFLDSNHGSLEHDPVLIDLSIPDESTHGGDSLLGNISLGHGIGSVLGLLSNTVHLLVQLGTMEVTVLTGTGNSTGNTGRMPRSNTGNLSQTTMRLTGKTGNTPAGGDSLESTSLGHTNHINVLVLGEHTVNGDLLLEKSLGKVDLSLRVSSVNLDLHDVSLLQAKVELLHLGVRNHTYHRAELHNTIEVVLDIGSSILVLLRVLGVSLTLGSKPVLVASALELLTQMLGKHGGKSPQTTGSLHVSNHSNDHHGWGFEDGHCVDNLALVHQGTGAVYSTDDVGHAGLVSAEGREMGEFGGVILGE